MDKSIKITLIVAITFLLVVGVVVFGVYKLANPMGGQTITIDGSSTIKVTPDVVTIHFNIETNGTDTKSANDANAVILDKLLTELVKLGFSGSDLKTESFNIYPWTEWNGYKSVDRGYKASHQVSVVLNTTDASLIGDVIDAGVNAGALLSYINFELSDVKQNEYKAQALKKAGEDAKTKAQATADGLGLKVGSKPVSVTTSDFRYQPWNVYSMAAGVDMATNVKEAKVAAGNIVPGQQDVSANIQVVYKLS